MTTDYLVIGCGAMAIAFVDAMLEDSDATFTIVDRRHAPGGHWIDAYPFVKLHQPSSYYGVASKALGHNRIDQVGFNAGYFELASGVEVTHYFYDLMYNTFLPSGRVSYYPMNDYVGDGEFVSLLSGERHKVSINKKIVDGTLLQTSIPLTHTPKFSITDGVDCIPPNHLPRLAPNYKHFTVLGSGKTGIDCATWLLENGVAPEAISWVVPRDPWLINRATTQPGLQFFNGSIGGLANQYEICAVAQSVDELCQRMEEAGIWLRLDSKIQPSMIHGATISEIDLQQLQRIPHIIRLGRVQGIESDRIILDDGEVPTAPETLYIDCTARALAHNVGDQTRVFSDGKISLQMIRQLQPCFSAALIGFLEANINNEDEKQHMTLPAPVTDTVIDWMKSQVASMANQYNWSKNEKVRAWMQSCRLNGLGNVSAQVREDDDSKLAILTRLSEYAPSAIQNLQKLIKGNPAT